MDGGRIDVDADALIVHRVADYDAWKAVFDAAAGIRREAGERSFQVLCAEEDPETLVHFSTWTSTAAAREFFESARLQQILSRGPVSRNRSSSISNSAVGATFRR